MTLVDILNSSDPNKDELKFYLDHLVSGDAPVSYTHLRAHETDQYLVCRLLLEKKKNHDGEDCLTR